MPHSAHARNLQMREHLLLPPVQVAKPRNEDPVTLRSLSCPSNLQRLDLIVCSLREMRTAETQKDVDRMVKNDMTKLEFINLDSYAPVFPSDEQISLTIDDLEPANDHSVDTELIEIEPRRYLLEKIEPTTAEPFVYIDTRTTEVVAVHSMRTMRPAPGVTRLDVGILYQLHVEWDIIIQNTTPYELAIICWSPPSLASNIGKSDSTAFPERLLPSGMICLPKIDFLFICRIPSAALSHDDTKSTASESQDLSVSTKFM